ncbi:MAG: hypothetical protein Hens2KO_16180 [Henriciella sp.]
MSNFAPSNLPTLPVTAVPSVPQGDVSVVTVDVFDTILLRKPISEVRRHTMIAKEIKKQLDQAGLGAGLTQELIRWTRRKVEKTAFRAREVHGNAGEVSFRDIVQRQRALLALPQEAEKIIVDSEIAVEKRCLVPNSLLIEWLKEVQKSGRKIVAISDTTLPLDRLIELITAIAGEITFDDVFSSADVDATKRAGDLFSLVLSHLEVSPEHVWHMGDNELADVKVPLKQGFSATHLPRSRSFILRRRIDGGLHVIWRGISRNRRITPRPYKKVSDLNAAREAFGANVLGPLVLEFALLTWAYLDEVDTREKPVALFCARGGLLMHLAFEKVLNQLSLDLRVPLRNVMISRLVASRLALGRDSTFVAKEIAREFVDVSVSEALNIVAGTDLKLSEGWDIAVSEPALKKFFESDDADRFVSALNEQNTLFERHLEETIGADADRVILIDTGLFGSTLKLMQDAQPHRMWESVMLARSNYKGFPSNHFGQTLGIWTEHNSYQILDHRTAVLRYWQLIELVFEPSLESVVLFNEHEGHVSSNLQKADWQIALQDGASPYFSGVMSYIDTISPETLPDRLADVERSWRRFKTSVVFPDRPDLETLSVGARSRDFGRTQTVADSIVNTQGKLRTVKAALWKAGAIRRLFPFSARFLQFGLESYYFIRMVMKKARRLM